MITEKEIKSVISALSSAFSYTPIEIIEDVVGDQLLFMLEKDYKMTAGNLYTLSRFKLYKEIKHPKNNMEEIDCEHLEVWEGFLEDRYLPIKDGTVDEVMRLVEEYEVLSERDLRIFTKVIINREPVCDVAEEEGLAVSPTYRIIKRAKLRVQKISAILSET